MKPLNTPYFLAIFYLLILSRVVASPYPLTSTPLPTPSSTTPIITTHGDVPDKALQVLGQVFNQTVNNNTVDKRAPFVVVPSGTITMYSLSGGGTLWESAIDMHVEQWMYRLTHRCSQHVDGSKFLKAPVVDLGVYPLSETEEIWYATVVMPGVAYMDFNNVLTWGVNPNYRDLENRGLRNIWSHWNPYRVTNIASPWLRSPFWYWRGYTQSQWDNDYPGIRILIFKVARSARDAGVGLLQEMMFHHQDPAQDLMALARAHTCLPNVWSRPEAQNGAWGPTAAQQNPRYAMALTNMNDDVVEAERLQGSSRSSHPTAVWSSNLSIVEEEPLGASTGMELCMASGDLTAMLNCLHQNSTF